jgi:hypothetical protein
MKIRFQADADLKKAIVTVVKRQGPTIDFQTAQAAGLEAVDDLAVRAIAAREGRILVSHDRRTMPHHFAKFITDNESLGLLIVSQHIPVAIAAEELILIWAATAAEEWVNQISSIPV